MTDTPTLTVEQAEALAEKVLAAIYRQRVLSSVPPAIHAADRQRVASDLAGLRDVETFQECKCGCWQMNPHAYRYSDGLIRTAKLYGATL